ncbi:MAG: CopG family antitoxin [Candidatus Daviesbacteria bacterium]|nr:CopG family antitoxin [Candidatus Daviesbacteria bacterium]
MKKKLVVPKFKNEEEEHDFWVSIDLSQYFEPSDFKHFNLEQFLKQHQEAKTTRITIRIPTDVIKSYKEKASQLDVPYQSLMKQQLAKGA